MNELVEKLKQGITLTESEIEAFKESYKEVDYVEGQDHRWYREIKTVVQTDDNEFYAVEWNRGLTEMQENEYPNQPYKVTKKEKVVTITEWVKTGGEQ